MNYGNIRNFLDPFRGDSPMSADYIKFSEWIHGFTDKARPGIGLIVLVRPTFDPDFPPSSYMVKFRWFRETQLNPGPPASYKCEFFYPGYSFIVTPHQKVSTLLEATCKTAYYFLQSLVAGNSTVELSGGFELFAGDSLARLRLQSSVLLQPKKVAALHVFRPGFTTTQQLRSVDTYFYDVQTKKCILKGFHQTF